jgi:hypothetical protein
LNGGWGSHSRSAPTSAMRSSTAAAMTAAGSSSWGALPAVRVVQQVQTAGAILQQPLVLLLLLLLRVRRVHLHAGASQTSAKHSRAGPPPAMLQGMRPVPQV